MTSCFYPYFLLLFLLAYFIFLVILGFRDVDLLAIVLERILCFNVGGRILLSHHAGIDVHGMRDFDYWRYELRDPLGMLLFF